MTGIAPSRPRSHRVAAFLFVMATFLAARPIDAATSELCLTPAPPENQRFHPLTETPPRPWPASSIRADHPRLFFDAEHLRRFRAHWNDPSPRYASVVKQYKYDTSLDPVYGALRGLATDDPAACRLAAQTVLDPHWRPIKNLASGPPGGFDWNLFGPPQYAYGDADALVFDWCYAALTPETKSRLVARIERQNALREAALDKKFQWHEAHFLGMHAYLMGVLAIEGEPGAGDRLQKAQNVLQNWTDIANELHGDGSYKTYTYQDNFFITPAILWSMATGQDAVRRNRFIMHHTDFLLRRLSQDGKDFIAGPGDQPADARGMVIPLQEPSPLGPLMIADYLHDGRAQWLGRFLLEKQGFGKRWNDPLWLDLIFHDGKLTATPPGASGTPLIRYLPQGGMVDMRSAWNIGDAAAHDIDAWFYLGPMTEHAETDAGDFTLWRGDDDLIVDGEDYFSRPTRYHLLWSALSFARNTAVFSPFGSATPDLDGSELPPPTMVFDDGQAFGDIGAERLVKNESAATRRRLATLSAEAYPVANRIIWYPEYAAYLGRITDFHDGGAVATVTGDATAAYDPRHVESYRRSVIDVTPDIFIIRDRFRLRDVSRVRMLFHTRERPDAAGLRLVKGTAAAGILEATGDRVTVTRGRSQATIQVVQPDPAIVRLVGGPGYENYIDGADIDPRTTSADWLLKQPYFPALLARVTGTWRAEIETDPKTAGGETIVVISVGARGAIPPDARLVRDGSDETIELRRADGTRTAVRLPSMKEAEDDIGTCVAR
jgi:hypothetical protein